MTDRHKNRGGLNKIELAGRKFGKLTVIKDTGRRKSKRPIWKCKCDCGTNIDILGKYLLNGDTRSCGCIGNGGPVNKTGYKELSGSYWCHVSGNAKRRGVPIAITAEYAYEVFTQQNKKCAISGVDINLVSYYRRDCKDQTASLDRIDNTKGYEKGNIQWVHKQVNIIRNALSIDSLLSWCKLIIDHSESKNDVGKS